MDKQLHQVLIPFGVAIASSVLLLLIRSIAYRRFHPKRRETSVSALCFEVIRTPSFFWCIAVGLYAGLALSDIGDHTSKPLYQSLHVIVSLSITAAIANLASTLFRNIMKAGLSPTPTSGLVVGIIQGAVYALGGLFTLSLIGVSIAPLLTALGVGGLAVALALKDTLENFFAGIYLLTDRTIRVGNFVRLESGQEGRVEDISWRTTRIQLSSNNTVILPNSKLAGSILVNYSIPANQMAVTIPIPLQYGADPEQVESTLLQIVKQGSEDIAGLLTVPEPSVRFNPGFGLHSMDFTLSFFIRDLSVQGFIQHELRKRIYRRFNESGIPFAIRPFVTS